MTLPRRRELPGKILTTLLAFCVQMAPLPTPGDTASTELSYYSDYFSFVGRDEKGLVAFALDTNRGRDGDDYQAEHFVVLHDEHEGWIELKGNGAYPNKTKTLIDIPDSTVFQFGGDKKEGIGVVSKPNSILLKTGPLREFLDYQVANRETKVSSGTASLVWNRRMLVGRIIHEYVHYENWNRLTRTYWGTWNNFQAFYLVAWPVDGVAPWLDLYVESTGSGPSQEVKGFLAVLPNSGRQSIWHLRSGDYRLAPGLYLWPTTWKLDITDKGTVQSGPSPLANSAWQERDGDTLATWVIGGFRMGIASGELNVADRRYRVYGLSELIK